MHAIHERAADAPTHGNSDISLCEWLLTEAIHLASAIGGNPRRWPFYVETKPLQIGIVRFDFIKVRPSRRRDLDSLILSLRIVEIHMRWSTPFDPNRPAVDPNIPGAKCKPPDTHETPLRQF